MEGPELVWRPSSSSSSSSSSSPSASSVSLFSAFSVMSGGGGVRVISAPPPTPIADSSSSSTLGGVGRAGADEEKDVIELRNFLDRSLKIPHLEFSKVLARRLSYQEEQTETETETETEENGEKNKEQTETETGTEAVENGGKNEPGNEPISGIVHTVIDLRQPPEVTQALMRKAARENGAFSLISNHHAIDLSVVQTIHNAWCSLDLQYSPTPANVLHSIVDDSCCEPELEQDCPFALCCGGNPSLLERINHAPKLRDALIDYAAAIDGSIVTEILGALAEDLGISPPGAFSEEVHSQYTMVVCVCRRPLEEGEEERRYDYNCPLSRYYPHFLRIVHEGDSSNSTLLATVGSLLEERSGGKYKHRSSLWDDQSGANWQFQFMLVPNTDVFLTQKQDEETDS